MRKRELLVLFVLFCAVGLFAGSWGLGMTGYISGENHKHWYYEEDFYIAALLTLYGIIPISNRLHIEPAVVFSLEKAWGDTAPDGHQLGAGLAVAAMFKPLALGPLSILAGPRVGFFGKFQPSPSPLPDRSAYYHFAADLPLALELALGKTLSLRISQSVAGCYFLNDVWRFDDDAAGINYFGVYLSSGWDPSLGFNLRF